MNPGKKKDEMAQALGLMMKISLRSPELAHYANACATFSLIPNGLPQLEGIHSPPTLVEESRKVLRQKLQYFDPKTIKLYSLCRGNIHRSRPHVLAVLSSAYKEKNYPMEANAWCCAYPHPAPNKVAILPLTKKTGCLKRRWK